jgi:signal transduction histidine kinase
MEWRHAEVLGNLWPSKKKLKNGDREKATSGPSRASGGYESSNAESLGAAGTPEKPTLALGYGDLDRLRSELKLATAALVTSQEMERKRMAAELHDSIGQELNALSFGIQLAIGQLRKGLLTELGEMLESLSTQVRGTIEETRRIALDLRPAMLDDLGVIGTLSWFFRQVRTLHPNLNLKADIDAEEQDIPDVLRTPIYRVTQEATSNVVKHSNATEVRVILKTTKKRVELRISDNGGGFNIPSEVDVAKKGQSSCGLTGMRNRVEFSGGEFAMISAPGKGTSIKAVWTLQSATVGHRGK